MPLEKYKALQADVKDGVVSLPERAVPVGILMDYNTGQYAVAFLMRYEDWVEAFPKEAGEGVDEEAVSNSIGNVGGVSTEEYKGGPIDG